MNQPTKPIRLGIDLGSTLFRVAYVHPDDEQAYVTVPISIDEFRPCFPIAERRPVNEMYASRYFPSLIQRLDRDFELNFGGRRLSTQVVLAELIERSVAAARSFSGRAVERLVLSGPIWLSGDARAAVREAGAAAKAVVEVCGDAQALAAWRRFEPVSEPSGVMLFFVAGYTGVGVALARATARGVTVLSRGGHQGVLAGNCLDFSIMQAAYDVLKQERVATAETIVAGPWIDLQTAAQTAKEIATEGRDADLAFPEGLAPEAPRLGLRVSASVFRRVVDAEVGRAMALVAEVLEEADVAAHEVGQVLLLGGTTHIPLVRERLGAAFSGAQVRHVPSESVAFGAARLAQLDQREASDGTVDLGGRFFYPRPGVETGLVYRTSPGAPATPRRDPPIEEATIAGILRVDGAGTGDAVRRLRELEQAAARERARLEGGE